MKAKSFTLAVLALLLAGAARGEIQSSTATGNSIFYDNQTGQAIIEGNAKVVTTTATLTADKITVWTASSQAHLEGNVVVQQETGTIRGSEVFYDWNASTGLLINATGESPPWRFAADRMVQTGPNIYQLNDGDFTSCNENPPHYRFRASKAKVIPGERATLKNSRFLLDETPAFWSPYYSRSLKPKKYTLRIEPGSSGRDGLITRTTFGYPFTPHTRTKLKWDYFQYTGNGYGLEHQYDLPDLRGNFNTYYIEDRNPDAAPETRRWNVNWDHYEKFSKRLTGNAHVNFKSDQTFGNNFSGPGVGLVENQTRGLLSEAGLNYQFSKASLQAQFNRQDRFDSTVSSEAFIGKVTLPRLSFDTIPMKWKKFPFYTNFSATYINETQDRFNPNDSLRYRHSSSVGAQIRQDFRLSRKTTLTPRAGYTETWQDHDFSQTSSSRDIYQGRYNTGLDLRRRFLRIFDGTIGHSYGSRLRPNGLGPDTLADDRGVEQNQISASVVGRLGRDTRLSLSSGLDVRRAPRSLPEKYRHLPERITSPSLDLQWEASRTLRFFFRETYSLFDPVARRNQRTPLNTSGEMQFGGETPQSMFFSQGFNFSKTAAGQPSVLNLTNKLRTYVTKKWYIDLTLAYRAEGPSKLDYRRLLPTEKTLSVVRDLHCWILRMEFSDRAGVHEASFFIDLKANLSPQKNLFSTPAATPFYTPVDEGALFPPEPVTQK